MASFSLQCDYEQAKVILNACYAFDNAGGFNAASHPTRFVGRLLTAVYTPAKVTGDCDKSGNRIIEKSFLEISSGYYQVETLRSLVESAKP